MEGGKFNGVARNQGFLLFLMIDTKRVWQFETKQKKKV